MRRNAKPVYVVLAVLFAATFAFLGVGSGSSGLDQLFSGLNIFHHSGTSISSAQKRMEKHPTDPQAWRDARHRVRGARRHRPRDRARSSDTRG